MKTLLVATANTPRGVRSMVAEDRSHRIDYLELADRMGADCVDYGVIRKSRVFGRIEETLRMDLRLCGYVGKLIRDEGYECVVSLSERVGLPLTTQLPESVRHVVIVHHAMSPSKLATLRMFGAARKWDQIIAVSPSEAKGLAEALHLREGAVAPLLAAVDTEFYRPPAEEIPWSARDHIQSLGSSHRDYPTLLRALRTLPHVPCEIRLGSTWIRNRVTIDNERMPANVRLEPFVPPHELRDWYARQRFSVISLQEDTQWSAGCTSIQHAQAMGRAIIATDRPGLHSYMIPGETGLLVRPGDAQDLAAAIEFLWRNPDKADEMGRRGREFVAANHSMSNWLDRLTSLIDGVRAQRPSESLPRVACEARLEL